MVDALRGRGREAKGLDRYTTREDFLAKDLDEVTGAWAAIVFWHSLEHLPEPTRALRSAKELLLPDGVMVIAVPNYASLQAAVFGDRWFPLDLARHLVHIPARSLLDFLKAQGLTIGRVSYTRGGQVVFGWLHGLVGAVWSGSDLYDTIRSKQARSKPMSTARRVLTLALGAVLLPVALIASAAEVALRRSGTVYVEARLPARDG